jgi:hypothetical protein
MMKSARLMILPLALILASLREEVRIAAGMHHFAGIRAGLLDCLKEFGADPGTVPA